MCCVTTQRLGSWTVPLSVVKYVLRPRVRPSLKLGRFFPPGLGQKCPSAKAVSRRPKPRVSDSIFKHACTPHTKKGITQVHKYYANQVHTHTSTQSYMNPLYKSFTQIVYEYGHHVSDPVSTGPRGRQQVHRRKLRIDRSRHLVYRKESN